VVRFGILNGFQIDAPSHVNFWTATGGLPEERWLGLFIDWLQRWAAIYLPLAVLTKSGGIPFSTSRL